MIYHAQCQWTICPNIIMFISLVAMQLQYLLVLNCAHAIKTGIYDLLYLFDSFYVIYLFALLIRFLKNLHAYISAYFIIKYFLILLSTQVRQHLLIIQSALTWGTLNIQNWQDDNRCYELRWQMAYIYRLSALLIREAHTTYLNSNATTKAEKTFRCL